MSKKEILPGNESVFKANLHSHTTYSDGVMNPRELKELYQRNGYSIIAYTDHNNYYNQSGLTDENFLAICGYELNFDLLDEKGHLTKTCHINALALDPDHVDPIEGNGPYGIDVINDAVAQLLANGFIVNLNHPAWSNMSPDEVAQLEGFTAMELYNAGCARTYNIGENQLHYDAWLKRGKRAHIVFADDNHASTIAFSPLYAGGYHPGYQKPAPDSVAREPSMDSCFAYASIYSPELSYNAIMESLVSGRYYCSTGPTISAYYIEDETIHIACSPVRAIFLKTMAWGISSSIMDPNGGLTHAEFDLKSLKENDEQFFRIELVDRRDQVAYTNPYFLSDQ